MTRLPVERIVSTMQSATEWLVLLGEEKRLVARTDFDHQPELAALPSIGGGLDPSAEAVAALKPDVVLGWRNRSSVDLEHALLPFHIPVLSFETTDTADVFRNLTRLGILVDRRERADLAGDGLACRPATGGREARRMPGGKHRATDGASGALERSADDGRRRHLDDDAARDGLPPKRLRRPRGRVANGVA